jgi:hypothetical protein
MLISIPPLQMALHRRRTPITAVALVGLLVSLPPKTFTNTSEV